MWNCQPSYHHFQSPCEICPVVNQNQVAPSVDIQNPICYPVYAPWKLRILGNGWVNFGFVIKDVRKYRLSLLDRFELLWYNSSTFH